MRKPLLIGGVLGLILGLVIWIVSLARATTALKDPKARAERIQAAPSSTSRGMVESLGEGEPAKGTPVAKETAINESARATAIRYAWLARMPIADYGGALDVIAKGGLGSSEGFAQFHELADRLVPADWVAGALFPYSEPVVTRYRQPGGPADLSRRWDAVNTLVDRLPADPAKIDLLARLELFARVLGATAVHKPGTAAPGLPSLNEVDQDGHPKPATAAAKPTSAVEPPLIDVEKETHRLRSKLDAQLRLVEDETIVQACWREARSSWNLLLTGFLAAIGTALGALFKTYGESLATRLQQRATLGLTAASPVASSPPGPAGRDA